MSKPYENFKKNIEEIKKFSDFVFGLGVIEFEEIIKRQIIVIVISITEVYLEQTFLFLLKDFSSDYFRKIKMRNGDSPKSIRQEIQKIRRGCGELINLKKVRYNFQNINSIREQFSNFDISLSMQHLLSLETYFDVRHVFVHKFGGFDEKFKRKYGYEFFDEDGLLIYNDFVYSAISDVKKFADNVEKKIEKKYTGSSHKKNS